MKLLTGDCRRGAAVFAPGKRQIGAPALTNSKASGHDLWGLLGMATNHGQP